MCVNHFTVAATAKIDFLSSMLSSRKEKLIGCYITFQPDTNLQIEFWSYALNMYTGALNTASLKSVPSSLLSSKFFFLLTASLRGIAPGFLSAQNTSES